MIRTIIHIDEEKCDGCGLCARACHEGAIEVIDGKAKLVSDSYCDGLGDCLPACPQNAISFVEREAQPYDEAAVKERMEARGQGAPNAAAPAGGGCPGAAMRLFDRIASAPDAAPPTGAGDAAAEPSQLTNWPVQIKLAPPRAPYFDGAELLVAADCCAFSYGSFHRDFIRGKVCLIGCPKLDAVDYSEKLAQIIAENDIAGIAVTRMEVPCCKGLEIMVRRALQDAGKDIPLNVTTFSLDGKILP